ATVGGAPLPLESQEAFDSLSRLTDLAADNYNDAAKIKMATAAAHKMVGYCSSLDQAYADTPAGLHARVRHDAFKQLRSYGREFEGLAQLRKENKRVFDEHPERQAAFR